MAINLRLYGDQIYPNISSYLSKYISPEITKEDFLSMYKSGHLEFKQISLKEAIHFHPLISIEKSTISNLEINIPEQNENFTISLKDVKCLLIISEIDENEVEKIMIEDKKKLINDFINYAVKKVEKKDGPSFFDNIIKSVLETIINGLAINVKNFELAIKAKNRENAEFIFFIENFNYSINEGIKINNLNIIYQKEECRINIIEKFDINVQIKSSEEEGKSNQINILLNDAIIQFNKDIYLDLINIFNIFDDARYKKIYIKYKKLILFKKNGNNIDDKKDYKYLWFYAIKTIIKLQKYIKYDKSYIFDLINSSQIKIIQKYLNDETYIDNILLSDDDNALKATKTKVEKKIIDNKNSNVLSNAFSFFFGAKKEETNKELNEEEKQIFEEIYDDANIIKYLNNEIDNSNDKFNIIFERVKKFLSNVTFNFEFTKLNLYLLNDNIKYNVNLYINLLKLNINYVEKQYDMNFIIDDIGYQNDKSFFKEKNAQNAIEINIDKNNFIHMKIGFESIELKDELFISILIFFNSIKTQTKQKIFHEKNMNKNLEKEDNKEQIMNKISNFSFYNNFKMTYIPSLSIMSKDNKIELNLNNYSLNEDSINFSINIKDNYGIILNDLPFNLTKKEKNIISCIETPIEIILQKETLSSILYNYFEYNKEINKFVEHKIKDINENNNELFKFNYVVYKNIDFGNIDFNEYNLNFNINKIVLRIYKDKNILENSFIIDEIKLTYEKRNLNIFYNNLRIVSDIKSNFFLSLFTQNENTFNQIKNNSNEIILKKDFSKEEKEQNIKTEYNYGKIISSIINNFNFQGNSFNITLNNDNIILSFNLNKIIIQLADNKKNIEFSMDNWIFNADIINSKTKNIIKCDKKSILKLEFDAKIIRANMDLIEFNMDFQSLIKIYEDLSPIFNIKNNDNQNYNLNSKKLNNIFYRVELNINDILYELKEQYKFNLSNIRITNFNEKDNKSSSLYIKIKQLICQYLNNAKVIDCNKINIDCNIPPNEEKRINIICDDTNFNLSQQDFLIISSYIKSKEKNDYQKYYSFENINNINNNEDLLNFKKEIILNENIENMYYKSKISMPNLPQRKENLLNISISFPKIKLYLCKNISYEKIFELSMNNLLIKSYLVSGKELFLSDNFNHNFSIQNIALIYYLGVEDKINILTKRKEDYKEKQVEFIYGNDNCVININNNEINLRIEAFLMIFYYFKGNDIAEKSYNAMNEAINNKKYFQLNINNSRFQLSTSFNGKENLFLENNNLTIIYNNDNNKFPFGNYKLLLDRLSSNIILKNNTRKLFQTGKNFLEIELNYNEELIASNILVGDLLINLSYRDLVSFLRAYQLNLKLFNLSLKHREELILDSNNNKNDLNINIQKKNEKNNLDIRTPMDSRALNIITGELKFNKIDITLIDDSRGSYQPFLNFDFEAMKIIINPDNTFFSDFLFVISSYNYIACVWEPTIEKLPIKLIGERKKNQYQINSEIKSLLVNLSDMSISFTLLTFNNWLTKLELKTKKFEDKDIILLNKHNNEINDEPKSITKITNNKVINYTGIELNIIHNGKQISCPPLQKVELDNSDFNEIGKLKKTQYISLIYDEAHKFELPLEKIITLKHDINNIFIISENSLSENKTINISLYSPFVFKNQTSYKFKIYFSNRQYGDLILDLNPNSICGVPLNLINSNTNFCFYMADKNSNENRTINYSLDNIKNLDEQYKTNIDFLNKSFTMKLVKKFRSLRMLIIYSEYSIINCLPCDINVNYLNKKSTVEKSTQFYITEHIFDKLFISLGINTEYGLFTSDRINLLEYNYTNESSLIFRNNNFGKMFKLPFLFKVTNEEKSFIIYSQLIIYNNSGLNLNINFLDTSNLICFNVKEKINLISSNIDYKEEKLQFRCNNFFSNKMKIHKLLQISNYKKIKMLDINDQSPFDLIIKKKSSYIKIVNNPNFKEKIISIIFTVLPMCRIINLLSTKKFIIGDYDNITKRNSCWAIGPFERVNFQFFNRGINTILGLTATNLNSNKYASLTKFQFNKLGLFTLVADDDYIYNLDIKKSPTAGCLDVYVLENNINNSSVILENLSKEGITIYQKNYEKNIQILYPKDIAPLKIYDFFNKEFFFDTNIHNVIDLNKIKNTTKSYKISDKSIAVFQDNGIKMKISFYEKEKFNSIKSSLFYINYNIYIESIYISVVGDNEIEHPKLTRYNRYELLLLYLTNFNLKLNIELTTGLLNKNVIKTKLFFDNLRIYNMLNSDCRFPCILQNEEIPCMILENKIDYYRKQKILKFQSHSISIKKLKFGIDPDFWRQYFIFYDNVLYRMDLTYLNVNKIFLYDYNNDPK